MKQFILLLVIFTYSLANYANCNDTSLTIEDRPTWCDNLATEKYSKESEFIRESVLAVRNDLRASIYISNYYIACLSDSEQWLAYYGNALRSKQFCRNFIKPIKDKIRDRFPLMRKLLGLSQFDKGGGDSLPSLTIDTPVSNLKAVETFVGTDIKHMFPGMVNLYPLNKKEVSSATELLLADVEGQRQWLEKGDKPEGTYCAGLTDRRFIRAGSNCYLDEYKKLFLGDESKDFMGLPLLGYVLSKSPTNGQMIWGIRQLRDKAKKLLDLLDDEYILSVEKDDVIFKDKDLSIASNLSLFFFNGPIDRMVQWNDKYKEMHDMAMSKLEVREGIVLGSQIGVIVAWSVLCGRVFNSLLGRGMCEIPVGLGANVFFYVIDAGLYNQVTEFIFYRADGYRSSGKELNTLNDLEFAKYLSMAMIPFFTGVPKLFKVLKTK